MMAPIRWSDIPLRCWLEIIARFIALAIIIGLPFWWFMVQLAEHGWK
ncbi:MAG: PIG-S family GPI transamidase component [Deltaproteobacteria bacterium]|nr:PIG-S family GPI transamidase component [Deltaproteobacteria bacterium]